MAKIRLKIPKFRTGLVLVAWVCFGAYILSLPLLSNWANNNWFAFDAYSRHLDQQFSNAKASGDSNLTVEEAFWHGVFQVFKRQGYSLADPTGMCTLPAKLIHCADGQNFTELALMHRGVAVACGCGQGVFGEGLCPIDEGLGYTLSTFISTGPGTGAMAALSAVPIMYTWWYIEVVREYYAPSVALRRFHWVTMAIFQLFYGIFLFCSDCVFPSFHQKSTQIWITAFIIQSLTTAYISGLRDAIGCIVTVHAVLGILTASLLNVGTDVLFGMYNYWLGEALSLTIMFGVAPMLLLLVQIDVNPIGRETGTLERARTQRLTSAYLVDIAESSDDDVDEDDETQENASDRDLIGLE